MDYVGHFHRETQGFLAAVRKAVDADPAPVVPSCPDWSITDLVLHLGHVHRFVARIIGQRLRQPPEFGDLSWLGLTAEHVGWVHELLVRRGDASGGPPARRPLPSALAEWSQASAAALEAEFRATPADEPVWTWGASQTAGFWQRMQAIEAAIHRWDAENATSSPSPIDPDLAVDAIGQTFEVMAPMRRTIRPAPPGQGERFRFTRTDGPEKWIVQFDGSDVTVGGAKPGAGGAKPGAGGTEPEASDSTKPCDITLAGTASDLMLFLWQRRQPEALDIRGDPSLAARYFELVPPL